MEVFHRQVGHTPPPPGKSSLPGKSSGGKFGKMSLRCQGSVSNRSFKVTTSQGEEVWEVGWSPPFYYTCRVEPPAEAGGGAGAVWELVSQWTPHPDGRRRCGCTATSSLVAGAPSGPTRPSRSTTPSSAQRSACEGVCLPPCVSAYPPRTHPPVAI